MMVDQMCSLLTVKEEVAFVVPASHLSEIAGDVIWVILIQHTKKLALKAEKQFVTFMD